MKISLALLCLFLPLLAHATDVTVTCVAPTTRADGTKVAGAITFNLYGAAQGQTKQLLTTVPLTACTSLRTNVQVGTSCWDWTAVEARTDLGPVKSVESLHSAEACATVTAPPSPPNPPTNVTATTVTAYEYRPATQSFAAVGLVAAGRSCGPATKSVAGKTYCRVALADANLIVWPQDRSLAEVWVPR